MDYDNYERSKINHENSKFWIPRHETSSWNSNPDIISNLVKKEMQKKKYDLNLQLDN